MTGALGTIKIAFGLSVAMLCLLLSYWIKTAHQRTVIVDPGTKTLKTQRYPLFVNFVVHSAHHLQIATNATSPMNVSHYPEKITYMAEAY